MKGIALVPARGGSKGIPFKNKQLIQGIPLISYTLREAKKCKEITEIWVSSDDEEILQIANQEGVHALKRPLQYANDMSLASEVVDHFLQERKPQLSDYILYLQPTSPLRTAVHMSQAFSLIKTKGGNGVISVKKDPRPIFSAFQLTSQGMLSPVFGPHLRELRRQDMPDIFYPNGAIYLFSVEVFLKEKGFPKENIWPFLMDEKSSLDIDTPEDLLHFQTLISRDMIR